MVSEWDGTAWSGTEVQARHAPDDSLEGMVVRMTGLRTNPWRLPTIEDALGVPSILRSVSLISNATASLTLQAFRNSDLIARLPAVIARPHPYHTPGEFYGMSTFDLAAAGECVWWIASRDSDGYATALVPVPLGELSITENERNRLFPVYTWGQLEGTRYSPANPRGEFVHVFWLPRAGRLRGKGPLQYAKAAASVAIEAQEAAANFYAEGGNPSLLIKHAGQLSPERRDPDTYEIVTDPEEVGYNEAELLRNQWMGKPHNVPRVIDQTIESVEYMQPNEHGAQMLDTRDYSNGDAARMFGIPGALLEFGVPGASLTYQNIESVWTNFVRGCLAIGYLEKIEQALSDLQPRSTVIRFLTEGLQRADEKSRWEIYQLAVAVLGQGEAGEMARVREGLVSGNPEVAAILPAPPAAIPSSLPEVRTEAVEVRCDQLVPKRKNGITKLEPCNRLLSKGEAFVGPCPRCKTPHSIVAA